MSSSHGYTCACCDQVHDGLPPAIGFDAPHGCEPGRAGQPGWSLSSDECVMYGEDYFVRAVLRIPVRDADQDFEWGVWVSQSEANFRRALRPWNQLRPARLEPTFGWLSNELPGYPVSTLELKTMVAQQGRNLRPFVEVEHTDPLWRSSSTTASPSLASESSLNPSGLGAELVSVFADMRADSALHCGRCSSITGAAAPAI